MSIFMKQVKKQCRQHWQSSRNGFSSKLNVVRSCRITGSSGGPEQKCLRFCSRHSAGQQKLLSLINIWNATESMPSWGLT